MRTRITGFIKMVLSLAGAAHADMSANIGFASDYYYRGIFQAPSSVNGGFDIDRNGFYAGTWAADVKDGLEVDAYVGYSGEIGNLGYQVGYTSYFYTGDFDDTYQELNLGASFGVATLDIAFGTYDNFGGPKQDYTFYSLTFEKAGFYGKYAGFTQDFAGEYIEVGFRTSIAEIDVGISAIFANEDLVGTHDESLVLTIGKSFDLN